MLSCRYLYWPCGPPPTPTHALGSQPSLDRIAVSASHSTSRNPSTADFSDVVHEHPFLRPLHSALCSPARQTELARPRFADPGRLVVADPAGNPPSISASGCRHRPSGPVRFNPERTYRPAPKEPARPDGGAARVNTDPVITQESFCFCFLKISSREIALSSDLKIKSHKNALSHFVANTTAP